MPPHEEESMSWQLFIKDENGQYTPYPGIQDCANTIAAELDEEFLRFYCRQRLFRHDPVVCIHSENEVIHATAERLQIQDIPDQ